MLVVGIGEKEGEAEGAEALLNPAKRGFQKLLLTQIILALVCL